MANLPPPILSDTEKADVAEGSKRLRAAFDVEDRDEIRAAVGDLQTLGYQLTEVVYERLDSAAGDDDDEVLE